MNDITNSLSPAQNAGFDPTELINLLEEQQKVIGELQVKLHHTEEKAADLDNRVFQMRALLQSGKGFSQIMNLSHLLDAFMAVCRERYSSINSTVLLLDDLEPDSINYRVRGYFGLPDTFVDRDGALEEMYMFKIPHDAGLLWQLIHQGDVFAVRDMRKLPRFETAFKRWNLSTLQSDVWVPLVRGSDVLGILTLGECEDGFQISESDYSFLEEIAAVAATNIDSTLKYEKNERILSNLRTLYDVNQQLANVNDFKRLMKETLSTAVNALKAQKANLMLFDPLTGHLEIKVVWGNIPESTCNAINDGSLDTKSFLVGEGVSGLAAQNKAPVRVNDRTKIDQVGKHPVYCILSVPIIFGNDVEGVITLTNKVKVDEKGETVLDTLGRFGEDDEQLLVSLAREAGGNLNKAKIYSASITDRLTGMNNTRHFESRLGVMLDAAQKTERSLALAVIDIDHFKKINDKYGHKAGDLVIQKTAEVLQQAELMNPHYESFRYGGEEFCILMPSTTVEESIPHMEALRERIQTTEFQWEQETMNVRISIGVVDSLEYPTALALFEGADKALYTSKANGRNLVSYIKQNKVKSVGLEIEAQS